MLSIAYRLASSNCLRCQLHPIIFRQTHVLPAPWRFPASRCYRRSLHAVGRQNQEADAEVRDGGYTPFRGAKEDMRSSQETGEDGVVLSHGQQTNASTENEHAFNAQPRHQRSSIAKEELGDDRSRSLTEHPLGRIVGRPGQRQRETSATLQSKAMGRPFEVTIMHDIFDKPHESEANSTWHDETLSPSKDMDKSARDVLALDKAPSQKDVNDSIDALRPESAILEKHELARLANDLEKSYKTKQLAAYLRTTLQLDKIDTDSIQIREQPSDERDRIVQRSLWQAGRSPITERLPFAHEIRKSGIGKSKKAIVQQILRLAWRLESSLDLQLVGELELSLTSWQFAYLFSLAGPNGQPLHQGMITIPLLRRNVDIRPFEPDHIMRIFARKSDATEVATQIARGLHDIVELKVDLKVFKPLFKTKPFHSRLETIFSPGQRADIGRRTNTVIELKDHSHLIIHGRTKEDVHLARRALLLFLDLPSPSTYESREMILPGTGSGSTTSQLHQRTFSPEYATSELGLRHRGLALGRLVFPREAVQQSSEVRQPVLSSRGSKPTAVNLPRFRDTDQLVNHLSSLPVHIPFEGRPSRDSDDLWFPFLPENPVSWRLGLGKWLNEQSSKAGLTSSAGRTRTSGLEAPTAQTFIPDQVRLLSHFSTANRTGEPDYDGALQGPTHKFMRASFMPSPFGQYGVDAMRTLPRIDVLYDLESIENAHPSRIRAFISRQHVRVFLPGEAVDFCFVRDLYMKAKPIKVQELGLGDFNDKARAAIVGGRTLEYTDVVNINLPAWLIDPERSAQTNSDGDGYVLVPYLFDGCEGMQSTVFMPLTETELNESKGPPVKPLLRAGADHITLRYSEIDGTPLGGRRSETNILITARNMRTGQIAKHTSSVLQRTRMVVEAGIDIVRAFTKFGTGELRGRWEDNVKAAGNAVGSLAKQQGSDFSVDRRTTKSLWKAGKTAVADSRKQRKKQERRKLLMDRTKVGLPLKAKIMATSGLSAKQRRAISRHQWRERMRRTTRSLR